MTGGTVIGPDTDLDGVSIDSRLVAPGALFVAVRAGRDGHDFVADAMAAGASACLVDRRVDAACAIVVDDTASALTRLGAYARSLLGDRVVGITGSVGKTSTKDLAASVLRQAYPTWASVRSFNNELGVPLTLVNAPDDTTATVVEMGMKGLGHITHLCEMATPTMGVVTAVAMVHVENLGGIEAIAVAKRELVEALPAHGYAILNVDDPRVAAMAGHTDAAVVRYGHGGNLTAEHVTLDDDLRARFTLVSDWGDVEVRVAARGLHQVGNALAAAAVGLVWGVPLEAVADGLGAAELSPWRMEVGRTASGAVVINDAYNAGPASMEAALRTLAAVPATRHIAVLGLMTELGEHADDQHRHVAQVAHSLGVRVIAVGQPAYDVDEHVDDIDAAVALLDGVGPGDAVLVKASRAAGFEALAQALTGNQA